MGKQRGYKRDKPVFLLKFEGEQFDGLEITAKSLPLGQFFALQRMQERANADPDVAEAVVRKLAGVLISWNLLGDDDEAVPCEFAVCIVSGKPGGPDQPCSHCQNGGEDVPACEYTGLVALDMPFVLAIFGAWMEAMAAVPNHSSTASNGGGTSLEQSIPMDSP